MKFLIHLFGLCLLLGAQSCQVIERVSALTSSEMEKVAEFTGCKVSDVFVLASNGIGRVSRGKFTLVAKSCRNEQIMLLHHAQDGGIEKMASLPPLAGRMHLYQKACGGRECTVLESHEEPNEIDPPYFIAFVDGESQEVIGSFWSWERPLWRDVAALDGEEFMVFDDPFNIRRVGVPKWPQVFSLVGKINRVSLDKVPDLVEEHLSRLKRGVSELNSACEAIKDVEPVCLHNDLLQKLRLQEEALLKELRRNR